MPPKSDKQKSKKDHWKSQDAEWWEDTSLWIKNEDLAKKVFQRAQTTKDMRLVLGDDVVTGSGACDGPRTVYGNKSELEWDDKGCLIINDEDLIALIEASRAAHTFRVVVDQEIADEVQGNPPPDDTTGGGIGGVKVNAQCTC